MGYVLTIVLFAALVMLGVSTSRSTKQADMSARLAKIERKLQAVMDHLGVVEAEANMPEVESRLDRGEKIQAIKAYRDLTGASLKEAKDAVEEMAKTRGL
ncbi:ribosomal protein L7/L12 [Planosporangium thailandense]|nr:ribosomal protein L7/L12 [Planosporangium thailandense]